MSGRPDSADRDAAPQARGKPSRLIAIAGAGAVLVAAAVLFFREQSSRQVRLEGRTVDASGAPLPEVEIRVEIAPAESEGELPVERVSTRSDARGRFTIRCRVPWRESSYSLEASKAGFETVAIDDADELPNPLTLRFVPAQR